MQAGIEYVLRRMLFQPHSQNEFTLTAVLAMMVFILVLSGVGGVLNLAAAQLIRSLLVLVLGLAVELGVLGYLATQRLPGWAMPGAATFLLLAMVVPLACAILKGRYPAVLIAMLSAMAAAAVVVLAVHLVSSAVSGGASALGTGIQQNRQVERALR